MEFPIIVLVAGLTGFTTQLLKFLVKRYTKLNENVHNLWSYSGIPSSHTALVAGLTTVIGLSEGIDSAVFALTFMIGLLIVRDALGLRNYVNKSLRDIHKLVTYLPEEKQKEFTELHIRVGHTRQEVFIGAIVGVALAVGYYFLVTYFVKVI